MKHRIAAGVIVEAASLGREEFSDKIVFPPMLQNDYWEDKAHGFALPRYVGFAPWSSIEWFNEQRAKKFVTLSAA